MQKELGRQILSSADCLNSFHGMQPEECAAVHLLLQPQAVTLREPVPPCFLINHIMCFLNSALEFHAQLLSCNWRFPQIFLQIFINTPPPYASSAHRLSQIHCERLRISPRAILFRNAKYIEAEMSILTLLLWNVQRPAIISKFSSFLRSSSEPQGWPQHHSYILSSTSRLRLQQHSVPFKISIKCACVVIAPSGGKVGCILFYVSYLGFKFTKLSSLPHHAPPCPFFLFSLCFFGREAPDHVELKGWKPQECKKIMAIFV